MLLGAHISISGRIYDAVDRAVKLKCNCFQIFSRSPRAWAAKEISQQDATEFKKRMRTQKLSHVIVHIPYLINLATPEPTLFKKSVNAFIDDLRRAMLIGADYFVTHVGNHKGVGVDNGLKRVAQALDIIIEQATPTIPILLEDTAGSGSALGDRMDQIATIINSVRYSENLGICLDTCHAFVAGYNLATDEGLETTLKEIDRLVGLERLKVIHLNDSKAPCGSKLDRHEHIGKGKIGLDGFRRIVHHKMLKRLPFIIETPRKTDKDDTMNLKILRTIAG